MPAVFGPKANLIGRVALSLPLAGALALVGWWWLAPRTDWARRVGFPLTQPVPFSHQHHVSGLGVDCRFCHASVETSAQAGMPPTWTCMTCHSQIWTNAELLAPVRRSLTEGKPIAWNRVTDLPDYVYFNHAIHVAKGIGCASCHGDVAQMNLTAKASSMTMGFCLDCHRDPASRLRPESALYDTGWHRTAETPKPAELAAHYGVPDRKLTDCSICHR